MSNGIRRCVGALTAALFFAGLGVSLSGCPIAAELEDDDKRFTALAGAPGKVDCNQPIPDLTMDLNCDYAGALKTHCASSSCHNAPTPTKQSAGLLDLTLDSYLIARILEVPSKHIITCPGIGQCDLGMPQCDECRVCPQGDFLLQKSDVAESWILKKMNEFDVDMPNPPRKIGCGTAMPYPPGDRGFTAERRACLTSLFTWIANNGRPCALPSGGSGGGGAGGSGASGAGSGGTGGT